MRIAVLVVAAATMIAGAVMTPAVAYAARYDGKWSVLIVTENGDCDRGYRYEIAVARGKISYIGGGSFDLSGTVTAGGAVKVSIARGSQSASGTGRLSGNSGWGTWRGRTSSGECSGRWEAERR